MSHKVQLRVLASRESTMTSVGKQLLKLPESHVLSCWQMLDEVALPVRDRGLISYITR